MKERIERVINLSTASGEDVKEIILLHKKIFGSEQKICPTCPEQIRQAVNRLKIYYKTEYNV